MRAQHGPALACALVFSALLLTACGGGGGGGGSGAQTPPPVQNQTPVANAGTDQTVKRNATVTLAGNGSDADGDALAYTWVQTNGTPVTLSSNTAPRPTFTAPSQSGALTFSLVASDGKSQSPADTVNVNIQNAAPTAVAATSMSIDAGTLTMLDGSGSTDPDGDRLTYTWTQVAGPLVAITQLDGARSQIQVPNATTTLVFTLVVSDGEATSVTINVTINVVVTPPPTPTNRAPVVFADTERVGPRRQQMTLGASGYDPEGAPLVITWEQVEGTPVMLTNADTFQPSLYAPANAGRLRFLVRASDGQLTSEPAEQVVTIRNFAPNVSPVLLTPNGPRTLDDIVVEAYRNDYDDDAMTATYEWLRNGVVVSSQTSATFPASLTTKNDVIVARVTVNDGFESTVAEASTTILDSPPVLTAQPPPPTALNYGDTARFTVTASDADGDPVDIEVAHGPAGFSVDNAGEVTWTAVGPLFDRVTDFNWGVRVRGDVSSLMTGTFEVTDADRLYPLRRGALHLPAQHNGLLIGDFDDNGSSEMLIAGARGLYELSRNGSTYQQSWAYPFEVDARAYFDNEIHALVARDLDGDRHQEIFFAKGTQLIRLDGVERRAVASATLTCFALEFADLDADGDVELICMQGMSSLGPMRATVVDPATLAVIWASAELPLGTSLAVGNVDSDPALEIVTAGGYVFDGVSRQTEWAYNVPFGFEVDTGDLDGDGVEEIVGMIRWGGVRAYSAVLRSPLWEYAPPGNDLDALLVADANNDGRVEAIIANGQGGNVIGIGYNTAQNQLEVVWRIQSSDRGVSSITVGNVDADSAPEIVWGEGDENSGDDELVIAGFSPVIGVEWTSSSQPYPDGFFYGGALARIGGGAERLMFMTPRTQAGLGPMRTIALDPAAGTLEFGRQIGATNASYARAIETVDYNNDGIDELFLGSTQTYDGFWAVYDLATDAIAWQSPFLPRIEAPVAIAHADVNGDGFQELIGLTSNAYVYVYDVRTGALLWKSTGLGGNGIDIEAADLDDDGASEIVVVTSSRILVYGESPIGSAFVERASRQVENMLDVLVSDLNGDDVPEIYAIRQAYGLPSTLDVYDNELQPVRSMLLGVPANSVFTEESSFTRKNLLIGTGTGYEQSANEIWAIDPVSGVDVWRSPMVVGLLSLNSLHYVDVDADGDKEISFGTTHAMYLTR